MTAESDFAYYLEQQGRGTRGTNIFINTKPAAPDALVAVFGYAGGAPERTHDTSGNSRPSVQVWVRGDVNDPDPARTLIESIFNDFDGLTNTTINGSFYVGIDGIQSGATNLGKDELNRPEFSWNFTCLKRR